MTLLAASSSFCIGWIEPSKRFFPASLHYKKRYLLGCGWEYAAQQRWRKQHCKEGFPQEIVPRLHFLFPFCVEWNGLLTNYSTGSQNMNRNLVQSLEINLPHTLRRNIKFTIIWPPLEHPSRQQCLIIFTQGLSLWWLWRVHEHRYLYLREEPRILSKTFCRQSTVVLLFLRSFWRN